ncbi:MAG: Gfo/Idh/MocA family protein [Planctomyces sp.]
MSAALWGGAPYFVPAAAFGSNDRVVTGHIGTGGRGVSKLQDYMSNAAAVCDVDQSHLAEAVKQCQSAGRKVDAVSDYRRLLDRKDIDAIVVATPDHWHAQTAIDAMLSGKDVYCEKPLSLTIAEGRRMVTVAREHRRIVQTGTQQRSDPKFRKAVEIVRSGKLGRLKEILVGVPNVRFRGTKQPDSSPPADLDYDLWLGPAPARPYNVNRVHYNFRYFRDYSGGQITNWGAHHLDIAQWALDADQDGPVEVNGMGKFEGNGLYDVCTSCRATLRFKSGVNVVVGQLQPDIPSGLTFVFDGVKLYVDREVLKTDPPEIISATSDVQDESVAISDNHDQNFLECVKSRRPPISDVETGHRSASLCHLANISIELGRSLRWNPAVERFEDDVEANGKLARTYRQPWKV